VQGIQSMIRPCVVPRENGSRTTRPTVTTPPTDTQPPAPARPKPTLAQRIVAFTFIGAFGLTMLTVIMTGLYVRSPSARRAPPTPAVTLPPGIELDAHPGQRRVTGRAALAGGNNALPLTLVARSGGGGQLAARLKRGDEQKVFVVDVTVVEP